MGSSSTRLRALVVDDSQVALHTMSWYLGQDTRVEVVGRAEDGLAAVNAVRTLRPDVVLMDIQMPNMNGLEASRQITGEFPATKIILVTLHDTPEIREAAKNSGARWFIPKDLLTRQLSSVLNEIDAAPASEQPSSSNAKTAKV